MRFRFFTKFKYALLLTTATYLQSTAQVSLTATGGTTTGTFTTLNAAFTAINAGTHTGAINITINANTTEPAAPVPLLASGTSSSSYTAITIKPAGNVIINGAAAPGANRGIIELAGADNVTIDGDDPATPGAQNLSIISPTATTAGIACIRLSSASASGADGADNITIKNCILTGARSSATSTTASYGIQWSNGTATSSSSTGAYSSINTVINNNAITRCYYGIYAYGNSTSYYNTGIQILNNTIGSSTAANNVGVYGIYLSYTSAGATGAAIVEGNDVQAGDYTTGFGTNVAGIYLGTSANNVIIRKNIIHDVANSSTGGWGSCGINISASNTGVAISNNFIRDITAQNYSASLTTIYQNYGIYVGSSSTGTIINHNTIVLNKANLTTYGTSNPVSACINFTSTGTATQILNNILVNNQGTASTAAYGLITSTNSNISGAAVNNNAYYVNGNGKLGYYAGAAQATISGWQTSTGKEASGFFANPPFISTTDLHLTAGSTSQFESGGAGVATTGINNDIDGQVRPGPTGSTNGGGTAPDVGADEFDGTPISPPSVISANSGSISCSTAAAHTITAVIAANSGTVTTVTLNYNNGTAGSVVMTLSGGTTANGTWTATIPAATPANRVVTWSIQSVNSVGLSYTYQGTSYQDAPLTGVTAAATASVNPVCANSATVLTATLSGSTPAVYALPPAVSFPTSDEDLGNVTISQGSTTILNNTTPINSLAGTIGTAAGTAGSYSDFTSFGPYALTAGQAYSFSLTSLQATTAYSNALAIYIDYNRNGSFADAGEQVYTSAATTSGGHTETGTFTVPASAFSGLTRMRVISNEGLITSPVQALSYGEYEEYLLTITSTNAGGGITPVVSAYSWSNGTTTVGTTNPLTVNPAATTTYTATLTGGGCPIASNALVVTTIALPTAPTATNSSQCGLGVPTASVSGATAGQTYNWYAALTGGTPIQTGGSTYTTAINTTSTFYVSISNGTCESVRTPVTVTVSTPDAVTASASNTNPCANTAITLTATKAAGPITYTYTWTANPAAGSGITTSVTGATPSITPTLPGTYVYTVAASGTVCNTSATVTITVKSSPTNVVATASAVSLCVGGNVSLSAKANSPVTVLSENFNAATNSWIKTNSTTGGSNPASLDWTLRPDGYVYSSTTFRSNDNSQFYQVNADAAGSGTSANTILQSPSFSTMGLDTVTLKFFHHFKYYSGATNDSAFIEVSTNGTAWTSVQSYKGADVGAPATFAAATINLNAYVNQPTVYVRFHYTSGWGYYWSLDNVSVTGNGGTWAWTSSPAGYTSSVQNPGSVTPPSAATYTYTATVTNGVGCSASGTTPGVVVNPLPTLTFTPANASICAGSSVSITASGANTYSWTPATGLSATTGATVTANPAATTTYAVTGTNTNGCSATANKIVTVNTPPTIAVSPATATAICAGTSVSLTATGADTYSWSPATGLSATAGATVTASPAATTTYTITGTDVNGCTGTATKIVTVNAAPVVVIVPATAATICAGDSVKLVVSGAATYSWSPSATLSAATGDTVYARPGTTTTYTVTGNDGIGCTATATQLVTVNTLPTIGVSPATATTICQGNAISLTASGGVSYVWTPTTGLSAGTGATVTASPATTTTYTVTGTGTNGCKNTATKLITVNAAPVLVISPATVANICAGGNINLTASGAASYSWTPATGLSATTGATVTASPAATTTYTITGTGTNGCTASVAKQVIVTPIPTVVVSPTTATTVCAGTAVTLTTSGATTYSWSPSTGLSATTGATVIATPATTITYSVTGTTSGCSSTVTKLITVNALPTAIITAGGNSNFCQGGSVLLSANTGTGLTYSWRRNGTVLGVTTATYAATATGIYDVIVSNGTCPATSNTISVIVSTPPAPIVTVAGSSSICQGTTVVLSTDPNPAFTYQWKLNGVNIANANASDYAASVGGDYTVEVTNGTCVVLSAIRTITVNALPPAAVLPQGATTFCDGGAVTMFASLSPAASYNYQWTRNTVAIPGATSGAYIATTSGDYAVTVADANCASTSVPVNIIVNPVPTVPVITVSGNVMTTGNYVTYQWYRNGVLIPGATAQTYTATRDGDYTVLVSNFAGCDNISAVKTINSVGVATVNGVTVRVYPNPATNKIYVDASVPVNITILSIDGKEVLSSKNAREINIEALADGMYIMKLTNSQGLLIHNERLNKISK